LPQRKRGRFFAPATPFACVIQDTPPAFAGGSGLNPYQPHSIPEKKISRIFA